MTRGVALRITPQIGARLATVPLPRLVLERAIIAALRAEERRYRARQRAEASRYRRFFGWSW